MSKIEGEVKSLEGRLNNPKFTQKAPPEIIKNAQDNLDEAKTQLQILQNRLALLQ